MAEPTQSPIRDTDDEARALARSLIAGARFGALGVVDPESGMPMVSRIAIGRGGVDAMPITLISALSHHTRSLRLDPRCSLLLGEPGDRGDPLTHPRITLQAQAIFVERADPAFGGLRASYLDQHPKAKLYIDFTDFCFAKFQVLDAHLNGGFGKAFRLSPKDLVPNGGMRNA